VAKSGPQGLKGENYFAFQIGTTEVVPFPDYETNGVFLDCSKLAAKLTAKSQKLGAKS
jgi:hypothetical protein